MGGVEARRGRPSGGGLTVPALDLGPSERRAVARFVDRVASFHGIDDRVEVWNGAAGSVGPSDLVVSFAVAAAGDRERQLQSVAALARKVLIVVERNPERLGAWTRSRERRADALATVRTLWELGRVRDQRIHRHTAPDRHAGRE